MRTKIADLERLGRDRVQFDPTPEHRQSPAKRDNAEAKDLSALPRESLRAISSNRCHVTGQIKPPALDGILDAAFEISEKRRETLERLRAALEAKNVAEVFRTAKELVGFDDDEKGNRINPGKHHRTGA